MGIPHRAARRLRLFSQCGSLRGGNCALKHAYAHICARCIVVKDDWLPWRFAAVPCTVSLTHLKLSLELSTVQMHLFNPPPTALT
jgi:hypothetical protein